MNTKRAFTLTELLVVIAIIAVLAGLLAPVLFSMRKNGECVHAGNNFRSLAAGMMTYAGNHDSELPSEGESQPTWQSGADPESADAWYNVIPHLLGSKGIGDFAEQPDTFYERKNMLFVPAAKYPENRTERPLFAVSMNSKLRQKGISDGAVRLVTMDRPTRTVIFQESGLPGEEPLPGQSAAKYDGQSKSFANRTVARYKGRAHLVFGDGHVELLDAKEVVDSSGKAFFPQIGDGGGQVLWTPNPDADANQ